jgi:hypothetical protein
MTAPAVRGSQHWLQCVLDTQTTLIDVPLVAALGAPSMQLEWLRPARPESYREYRDLGALSALGVSSEVQHTLVEFWPRRGPLWDGLGRTAQGDMLLVEAKAQVPELASGRSQTGPESLKKISDRLAEVREFLAPKSVADWTHTFYQYANRLAFLYFLRHLHNLPAHLVFVYFINARDVKGPSTQAEWESALMLMYAAMGLPRRHLLSPFMHNLFVDVGPMQRMAA